jgi:hypothetical protein
MKAKDITTPGDYEVKHYAGPRKATITKVEQRKHTSYSGRSVVGHTSKVWYAIEVTESGREEEHALGNVLRPWAEAEPAHLAAEAYQAEGARICAMLAGALGAHDLSAFTEGGKGAHLTVTLSRAKAERLATLLNSITVED